MKLLNEILGTKYPIIQGGMANIATGEFAAACSNAGALGIIGAGGMNADTLRQNIRRCKELTDKPFGVNIMLMHPQADEFAKIVVEEGVPVVTTGAGNPGKYIPAWKAAGIKVIPVVAAAVLAKHLEPLGIDAVIASDLAVIAHARSIGLEVHMSVQANVCNMASVRFYAQYADVVVLARELTLAQIRHIIESIRKEDVRAPSGELLRVEIFAHGALCVAVSGKCHMSLAAYNSSANRGACFQNCRRAYRVTDEETGNELVIDNKYVMSPKDLKTIRFIDRMMDAGVRVFKIEGRARGPEYVYTVVKCYKEAIQSVLDDTLTEEKKDEWDKQLAKVFNRGFWDGYYQGQTLGEWNKHYGSAATEKKVLVGKVMKYFSKLGVAEVAVEASDFNKGEKLLITGPTTGVMYLNADEIRFDLGCVEKAEQGTRVSIPVPGKVRPSDKLYKLVTVNEIKEIK